MVEFVAAEREDVEGQLFCTISAEDGETGLVTLAWSVPPS